MMPTGCYFVSVLWVEDKGRFTKKGERGIKFLLLHHMLEREQG